MKTLRVGRFRAMFSAGPDGTGFAIQCAFGLKATPEELLGPGAPIYRVGWGWDADLPLRPWPAAHRKSLESTPGVHRCAVRTDWCAAWFGAYIGVSRYFWRDPLPERIH